MIKYQGMGLVNIPVNGGVDEVSPVNKVAPKNALKMENFRITRDGARVAKRKGLSEVAEFAGKTVYGHCTYYDMDDAYCQLVVTNDAVWRKVGGAAWASIHTFATEVAHPVTPIQIQGKQIIIHEGDSILVHHDKGIYQIGIDKPVTLPAVTLTQPTEYTPTLEVDFSDYADTGEMTSGGWVDGDSGTVSGESTIVSYGGSNRLKLTSSANPSSLTPSPTIAKRSFTTAEPIGPKFTLELDTYFDYIDGTKNSRDFQVNIWNGEFRLNLIFKKGNLSVYDLDGTQHSITTDVSRDEWANWKFTVDASDPTAAKIESYKDGVALTSATVDFESTVYTDKVELIGNCQGVYTTLTVIYVDYINISSETYTSPVITGDYKYAVTFFRGGNFGCESNAIKSLIGDTAFSGTGSYPTDLTIGGEYTYGGEYGNLEDVVTLVPEKTFIVKIDSVGTNNTSDPDTFKWSGDNGETWTTSGNNITDSIYLSYGLTLSFAHKYGHALDDQWTFTCSVCSATPVNQIVNLSAIPTSSDTQVTGRKLYRTTSGGSEFFWLATIYDNYQTTFVDNIPDIALGVKLEDDHDLVPNGKFSAWWDERLWVSGDDVVYYGQYSYPEHFHLATRYATVQRGDQSDEITGLVPYKDALYVFRKRSIYAIQKTSLGYGLFLITDDVGCIAPFSLVTVNNMLMFLSYRGIEYYNGADVYPVELSLPIDRTIRSIDTTDLDHVCAAHFQEKREVWFYLPGALKTAVYHYVADAWYFFTFHQTPRSLSLCLDSSDALVLRMGTSSGMLYLCESGYQDDATDITATYRKPWVEAGQVADIRRLDCEYEIPAAKSLTTNVYVNFDKDIQRTARLVGETISSGDIELRRPHYDFAELGQRAKYVSVEFTNAENLGGDLKINEITLYVRERAIKGKMYAD